MITFVIKQSYQLDKYDIILTYDNINWFFYI